MAFWNPAYIRTDLWLDASDSSTITTDIGVSEWRDKSGRKRHGTQVTDNNQPTINVASINGLNTLGFDGVNDSIALPELANLVSGEDAPWSVFIVANAPSPTNWNTLFGFGSTASSEYFHNFGFNGSDQLNSGRRPGDFNDQKSINGTTTVTETTIIAGYTFSGSIGSLYRDGIREGQTDQDVASLGTLNTATLCCLHRVTVGNYAEGEIAEVIFFLGVPTKEVRQKIEGYLAHKWGLEDNLASNHPYKISAPTAGAIWDPTITTTEFWWDPTDAGTITDDGSISQLADKSGNGYHLGRTAGAPSIDTLNGVDCLYFNGVTEMETTKQPSVRLTWFYVQHDWMAGARFIMFYNGGSSGGSHAICAEDGSSATNVASYGTNWGVFVDGSLEHLKDRGTAWELLNTDPHIVTSANVDIFSTQWGRIGIAKYGFTYDYTGLLGETIAIPESVMTDDLREKVEGYLTWKYFLEENLPINHRYRFQVPTVDDVALSGLWNPAQINPDLWLDASDASTIVEDTGVLQWTDKAGSGTYALQTTGENQPLLIDNALNGKPIVRFDGVDDYMALPLLTSDPEDRTIFVVAKYNNTTTGVLLSHRSEAVRLLQLTWQSATEVRNQIRSSGNVLKEITATINSGTWNLIASKFSNSTNNHNIWKNGSPSTANTTDFTIETFTSSDFFLGRVYDGTYYFKGDVAEILIFERVLTSEEHVKVEGYLAHKWNRDWLVPTTHNYRLAPPLNSITYWKPDVIEKMMWFDGDDKSSLRWDIGFDQWASKTIVAENASQTADASQPLPCVISKLGRQGLKFDGVNDYLNFAEIFDSSSAVGSIFILAKNNSDTFGALLSTRPAAGNSGFTLRYNSANEISYFHTGYTPSMVIPCPANELCLIEVLRNGLTVSLGINGKFNTPETISGWADSTLEYTSIGAENAGGGNLLDGEIAAILVLDRIPDSLERQAIEASMMYSMNIEEYLPDDHLYKNTAPKYYDHTLVDNANKLNMIAFPGYVDTDQVDFPLTVQLDSSTKLYHGDLFKNLSCPPWIDLLIHSNTTSGSKYFYDSSLNNHQITPFGAVGHSTSYSKFGTSSLYFTGDQHLIIPELDWNPGANDFTIDCWIKRSTTTSGKYLCGLVNENATVVDFEWGFNSSNYLEVILSVDGTPYSVARATTTTDTNWHHVAIVRKDNLLYQFFDGVLDGTTDIGTGDVGYHSYLDFVLGSRGQHLSAYDLQGYMDEFRISNIALWTSDFIPPTEMFSFDAPKNICVESNGVKCPVEIESWDSANEKATLHTKVPIFYADQTTKLVLSWDSGQNANEYVGFTSESIAQTVWDEDFVAVYHMSQDPSIGGACILDSTGNEYHGTPSGTMTSGDLVDGVSGKALDFDSDDLVQFGNIGSFPLNGTIECSINVPNVVDYQCVLATEYNNPVNTLRFQMYSTGVLAAIVSDGTGVNKTTNIFDAGGLVNNTWFNIAFGWDTSVGVGGTTAYADGQLNNIGDIVLYPTSMPNFVLGSGYDTTALRKYIGVIDEVRISNVVRSDDWIKLTNLSLRDQLIYWSRINYWDNSDKIYIRPKWDDIIGSLTPVVETNLPAYLIPTNLSVDDDFTGTDGDAPNPNLWDCSNVVGYELDSNKLRITNPSSGGSWVDSKFRIQGDFDVQVDWELLTLNQATNGAYNGPWFRIESVESNSFVSIWRWYTSAGLQVVGILVYINGSTTIEWNVYDQNTTDTSGTFSIVRSGSNVNFATAGKTWNSISFLDEDVIMNLGVYRDSALPTIDFTYDNFQVNSGTIVWPVDYDSFSATPPVSVNDDFTGIDEYLPNTRLWDSFGNSSALLSSNSLVNTMDSSDTGDCGVLSLFTISGDFDIEVLSDEITGASLNFMNGGLRLVSGDSWCGCYQGYNNGHSFFFRYNASGGLNSFDSTAMSAQPAIFRLVRSGATLTAFYKTTGDWIQIGSSRLWVDTDITVWLWSYKSHTSSGCVYSFDNFTVNSGTVIWAPDFYYNENIPAPPESVDDDFTGTDGDDPNPVLWDNYLNAGIIELSSNKLRLSATGTIEVRSKFEISGDFDVQVDLDVISGPDTVGWSLDFAMVLPNEDRIMTGRRYEASEHRLASYRRISESWTLINSVASSITATGFRIVRSNATYSMYYWDGDEWVSNGTYDGSTDNIVVSISLGSWTGFPTCTGDYDNFIVNSGTIVWPVFADYFNGWDGQLPDPKLWRNYGSSLPVLISDNAVKLDTVTERVGLTSNFFLTGDFDVSASFEDLDRTTTNSTGIRFFLTSEETQFNLRFERDTNYQYHTFIDRPSYVQINKTTVSETTSGGWRITRVGDVFSSYYLTATGWTLLGSTTITGVGRMWFSILADSWIGSPDISCKISDVKINEGVITYPYFAEYFQGVDGTLLSTDLWHKDTNNGNGTIELEGNRLKIDIPVLATDDLESYSLVPRLSGPFDIQIDFDIDFLDNPSSSVSYPAKISIKDSNEINIDLSRVQESTNTSYYITSNESGWPGTQVVTTTDTSGKFRMVRTSQTSLTCYVWNATSFQWEWNGNTAGYVISLSLMSSDVFFSIIATGDFNGGSTTYYDNFIINSGEFSYPVLADYFTGEDGDAPNPALWAPVEINDNGYGHIGNNSLNIGFTSSTTAFNTILSLFKIAGDFDIQVDFYTPSTDSSSYRWSIALSVLTDSGNTAISARYAHTDGPYRQLMTGETDVKGGSATSSGKLRITRVGSTTTLYYLNGTTWTSMLNGDIGTDDVTIRFSVSTWALSTSLDAYFDNFQVNSGTIVWPTSIYNTQLPIAISAEGYSLSDYYDPYKADVVLHLPFEDSFTDISDNPKTITAYGDAQVTTSKSRFGNSCAYFDGTGDYIKTSTSSDLTFGTGDFTVEFWINTTQYNTEAVATRILCDSNAAISMISEGFGIINIFGAHVVANDGVWHHVLASRESGVVYGFLDGALIESVANTTDYNTTNAFNIGVRNDLDSRSCFNGYLDDVRITKGVARYTKSFNVSERPQRTVEFPVDSLFDFSSLIDPHWDDVILAMPCNGVNNAQVLTDISTTTPKSLTASGDTKTVDTHYKIGGSSIYVDGGNDRIYCDHADFALGSTWTVEFWMMPTNGITNYARVFEIGPNVTLGSLFIVRVATNNPMDILIDYGTAGGYNRIFTTNSNFYEFTWNHITLTSEAGVGSRLFLNGVLYGTNGTVADITQTVLTVGTNTSLSEDFQGYYDQIKITKGVARYSDVSSFVLPTRGIETFSPAYYSNLRNNIALIEENLNVECPIQLPYGGWKNADKNALLLATVPALHTDSVFGLYYDLSKVDNVKEVDSLPTPPSGFETLFYDAGLSDDLFSFSDIGFDVYYKVLSSLNLLYGDTSIIRTSQILNWKIGWVQGDTILNWSLLSVIVDRNPPSTDYQLQNSVIARIDESVQISIINDVPTLLKISDDSGTHNSDLSGALESSVTGSKLLNPKYADPYAFYTFENFNGNTVYDEMGNNNLILYPYSSSGLGCVPGGLLGTHHLFTDNADIRGYGRYVNTMPWKPCYVWIVKNTNETAMIAGYSTYGWFSLQPQNNHRLETSSGYNSVENDYMNIFGPVGQWNVVMIRYTAETGWMWYINSSHAYGGGYTRAIDSGNEGIGAYWSTTSTTTPVLDALMVFNSGITDEHYLSIVETVRGLQDNTFIRNKLSINTPYEVRKNIGDRQFFINPGDDYEILHHQSVIFPTTIDSDTPIHKPLPATYEAPAPEINISTSTTGNYRNVFKLANLFRKGDVFRVWIMRNSGYMSSIYTSSWSDMYIGIHQPGTECDFKSAPIPLNVNGSNSVVLPTGEAYVLSDPVSLPIQEGDNIVVSCNRPPNQYHSRIYNQYGIKSAIDHFDHFYASNSVYAPNDLSVNESFAPNGDYNYFASGISIAGLDRAIWGDALAVYHFGVFDDFVKNLMDSSNSHNNCMLSETPDANCIASWEHGGIDFSGLDEIHVITQDVFNQTEGNWVILFSTISAITQTLIALPASTTTNQITLDITTTGAIQVTDAGGSTSVSTEDGFNDGFAHVVLFSWSASGRVIYLDGVALTLSNDTATFSTAPSSTEALIGQDYVTKNASGNSFTGNIAEFRAYDTEVVSNEVVQTSMGLLDELYFYSSTVKESQIDQPYGAGPIANWFTESWIMFTDPPFGTIDINWFIAQPRVRNFIDVIWGLKLGISFNLLYDDSPVINGIITERYTDAPAPRKRIVMPYGENKRIKKAITEKWETLSNPTVAVTQPYSVVQNKVVKEIGEPYSLVNINKVTRSYLESYSILEDTDIVVSNTIVVTNIGKPPVSSIPSAPIIVIDPENPTLPSDPPPTLPSAIPVPGYTPPTPVPYTMEPLSMTLRDNKSEYLITLDMTVLYAPEMDAIEEGQVIEVQVHGVTFTFIIDSFSEIQASGKNAFNIQAVSPTVQLDFPYANSVISTNIFDIAINAKNAVEKLAAPFTVDWQIHDWTIPANTLFVSDTDDENDTGESPLAVIKTIVGAVKGLVQSTPDGNLRVEYNLSKNPEEWSTMTPDYSIDTDDISSFTDSYDPGDHYNEITVGNQGTSSSSSINLVEFNISESVKYIKAFSVPFPNTMYTLVTSRYAGKVSIEPMGFKIEIIGNYLDMFGAFDEDDAPEIIEIVNGEGKASNPVYSYNPAEMKYLDDNLGSIIVAEDGTITTESGEGNSLLEFKYTTRYYLWKVIDNNSEKAQLYLV